MKIGKDSVVIGQVPEGLQVGDRSVYVGATDANGNSVLREGAYGYGARAGKGSLAVGAQASAGSSASAQAHSELLQALAEMLALQQQRDGANRELHAAIHALIAELQGGRSKSKIQQLWAAVNQGAVFEGGLQLADRAGRLLQIFMP